MEADDNNINKLISCVEIFKRSNETLNIQQENKVFSREKNEKKEGVNNLNSEQGEKNEEFLNPLKGRKILVNHLFLCL